jgi:hypothetical protein
MRRITGSLFLLKGATPWGGQPFWGLIPRRSAAGILYFVFLLEEKLGMKKFFAVFIGVLFIVLPAFAQQFDFSGEVKTGLYWESEQKGDKEAASKAYLHNNDDAGSYQGRLRLNFHYQNNTIGVKIRFEETQWGNGQLTWQGALPYAFAYGNFLNEQIKISAGRLGDSPWGTGGSEEWKELDATIGIRTEFKPAFVPGLNIGVVLNEWNNGGTAEADKNIGSLLQESVLGLSYDHTYFGLRFAYRLDSMGDKSNTTSGSMEEANEGEELIYRIEERALKNLLPGFQIWANGYYQYINSGSAFELDAKNWLYFQYAPDLFTAQLRLGYESSGEEKIARVKGSFYYNILSFLSAGAAAMYAQAYNAGEKSPNSPFSGWHIEPLVKVTLEGAFIEAVYHYGEQPGVETKTQWVNLRLVYTF